MNIERDIMKSLLEWKQRANHRPLIIQGARQIGKTWTMQVFGRENFESVAYFNFEASPLLCREFENTKNPEELLNILRLYTDSSIEKGRTLIVFDEIQQCNKALNSLKYFCEQAPEYHIIAAGSLLGVSLCHGDSFPVGKVEFLQMHPVSFREYLRCDSPKMYHFLENMTQIEPLPEIVFSQVGQSYKRYQVCGGMPAVVSAMLEGGSIEAVERIQTDILNSYVLDFAKHAPGRDIPRISAIWNSIPSQLAKENRKFVYKVVKTGARAREYEDALLWLEQSGLVERVFCCSKPGLPISAYDDLSAFKIYLCDAGLLRVLARLPSDVFWADNPLYVEFKGALSENMVLQSLIANFSVKPRYWTSEATAEVDFLLQSEDSLIPIEVKSGSRISGKSLGIYISKYKPQLAIRYSLNNLKIDGGILNIPIFLSDWTSKFLHMFEKSNSK